MKIKQFRLICTSVLVLTGCAHVNTPTVLASSDQYVTYQAITTEARALSAELAETYCAQYDSTSKYIPADSDLEYTYECISN